MTVRLVDAIRDFTRTIAAPHDVEYLLERLVRTTTSVLDAAGAGILLESASGTLEYAAASDERVASAEIQQGRIAEGACFDAFTEDRVVVVGDLAVDGAWPAYQRHVLGLGLHAVVGAPMAAGGRTIGTLNVYREAPSVWSPDDVESCEILASMGAAYLSNAAHMSASITLSEQLQHALDARVAIEQAKGSLRARHRLSEAAAFDALRRHARENNRKVRDVAQDVLDELDAALVVDLADRPAAADDEVVGRGR